MVVGFFGLLGSLTGILVETTIAAKLGLSRNSDTFYAGYTLPYIITNMLSATGQFSLVPFFASFDTGEDSDELWHALSYALNVVTLGMTALALVGFAFAPWAVRLIAPGFTAAQTVLASRLARWLFLLVIPAGMVECFRSFLYARRHFALPSATNFFRNSSVILSILLTFHRYGPFSIVVGYFLGYLVQLLSLALHLVLSFRVRYFASLKGAGEAFQRLHGAGAAQLGAALGWQGVVVVERIIASFLAPGSLTALNYGLKIMSTISELLSGSVGTSALPALSRATVKGEHAEERKIFRDALEISLALVSPAMVFCLLLPRPIIRLVFQRGSFTAVSTQLMAQVLFFYCLSLVLLSVVRLLTFYMFARRESALFMRLTLGYYCVTILFDLFYTGILGMGPKGIPAALLTSLGLTCTVAYIRNVGGLKDAVDRQLIRFAVKDAAAMVAAGALIGLLQHHLPEPGQVKATFLYLTLLCGLGGITFAAVMAVTRAIPLAQLAELRSGQ